MMLLLLLIILMMLMMILMVIMVMMMMMIMPLMIMMIAIRITLAFLFMRPVKAPWRVTKVKWSTNTVIKNIPL